MQLRLPDARTQGKLKPRWRMGLWAGKNVSSDEHLVALSNGIAAGRSIRRVASSDVLKNLVEQVLWKRVGENLAVAGGGEAPVAPAPAAAAGAVSHRLREKTSVKTQDGHDRGAEPASEKRLEAGVGDSDVAQSEAFHRGGRADTELRGLQGLQVDAGTVASVARSRAQLDVPGATRELAGSRSWPRRS